jgi:hypothetical protein
MANAMFATPMHPGKQVQRFADVSENHYHQARRADRQICERDRDGSFMLADTRVR